VGGFGFIIANFISSGFIKTFLKAFSVKYVGKLSPSPLRRLLNYVINLSIIFAHDSTLKCQSFYLKIKKSPFCFLFWLCAFILYLF